MTTTATASFDVCLTDGYDFRDLVRLLDSFTLTLESYVRVGPAGGNAHVVASGDPTSVIFFASNQAFMHVTVTEA